MAAVRSQRDNETGHPGWAPVTYRPDSLATPLALLAGPCSSVDRATAF